MIKLNVDEGDTKLTIDKGTPVSDLMYGACVLIMKVLEHSDYSIDVVLEDMKQAIKGGEIVDDK